MPMQSIRATPTSITEKNTTFRCASWVYLFSLLQVYPSPTRNSFASSPFRSVGVWWQYISLLWTNTSSTRKSNYLRFREAASPKNKRKNRLVWMVMLGMTFEWVTRESQSLIVIGFGETYANYGTIAVRRILQLYIVVASNMKQSFQAHPIFHSMYNTLPESLIWDGWKRCFLKRTNTG